MSFEGMDPDAVETLGHRINAQAETLGSILTRLDGLVASMHANWAGNDSDRFQHTYSGTYRTQLVHAQTALGHLASAALRNAGEQRRVSS